MFDRFIRLAEARRALKNGRYEQALQLAADPVVRSHRRAAEIRDRALEGLMTRARRRQAEGVLSAALSDVSRVLGIDPDCAGARTLKTALEQQISDGADAARTAGEMLAEARRMAAEGDLDAAQGQLAAVADLGVAATGFAAVRGLVESRRRTAGELVERAARVLDDGDPEGARALLVQARGHDRAVAGAAALAGRIAAALAPRLLERLTRLRGTSGVAAAYALLDRERSALPELDQDARLQRFAEHAAGDGTVALQQLLTAGDLERAAEVYRDLDPRLLQEPAMAPVRAAMDDITRALEARDRGHFEAAAEALRRAAEASGCRSVQAAAAALEKETAGAEAALAEARELAAAGHLVEARQRLLPLLERWPLHEAARAEMEILDRGAHDKEQRLARARELAREGCLREASALAVALAVPGPHGEEARMLLQDVRARMDLVARGLDQVRRGVHGRDSSSIEGLQHCVLRLEQLQGVQSDNDEVAALRQALEAEIEGLQLLERAAAALAQGRAAEAGEPLAALVPLRGRLLRPDRLDARILELHDGVAARIEDALASARLVEARQWLGVLEAMAPAHAAVHERAAGLQTEIRERRQHAEQELQRASRALEARDLHRAEAALERAREHWIDGPEIRRLERRLLQIGGQAAVLDEVEALAAKQDFAAAHHKLDHLPPTPAVLRTKIFDIKRGLAKAQGLDYAFLLRVDEGGEFLALRGESVEIGNVRDGKADLPILANIAGRHARLVRSMSFHGGMQDRVLAERGDVSVGGRSVPEHKLRSGDRFRLGSALELRYEVPSSRSLTAKLTLSSGFQVAGTDKVLLMKDRGRDGRILIGPTADAHIRTPHAQPEIELFAGKDGQIRVRFDGDGDIGGKPFRGEHPIEAGALIRCGEVGFVLLPWR